ncbi:glycoside hydrolase family 75 protein [Streptomyces sp. NPDC052101]|uniref:glycoside hydrolase family 75 protein n=1 Tax=Streptomyces sp. NPDC052101 TaxID=3155763 RepID=UPI00342D7551
MRVPSLTLAAAGATLLAPAALTVAAAAPPGDRLATGSEGAVAAADLLARTGECNEISQGRYRPDDGSPANVPVCGTKDAVFWKADLDVDCDGQPTEHCNSRTDPQFSATTAYQQSDGRYLNAETLPYIVVPAPSGIWNPDKDGVRGGSVVAVVYRDRVQYAVVGDIGPGDLIGEASYATAKGLGIPTDPSAGGAPSDVTYIVFKDSHVDPIEDHPAAVAEGERLAGQFVADK